MKPEDTSLGVIFDHGLNFNNQICSVLRMSFSQLRLLDKIKPLSNREDLEKEILAFILDHKTLLRWALVLQDAAAVDVSTQGQCYHHSTGFQLISELVLDSCSFVCKAINNLAPLYLPEPLTICHHSRALLCAPLANFFILLRTFWFVVSWNASKL